MRGTSGVLALAIAALSLGCGGSAASGPSRHTVETRVTATGEEVLLRWSPRHPWDTELMARGALLVAEYRSRNGAVGVDCLGGGDPPRTADPRARQRQVPVRAGQACLGLAGEAERNRTDRTIRFRLPETTTAVPEGPVCLYFRLANQRVLPVRRSDRHGTETARFRYPAWEDAAVRQAERRLMEARIDHLREGAEVKASDVRAQEAINARQGWSSRSACDALRPPEVARTTRDRPPTQPEEREAIARRVCIMRVWRADSIAAGSSIGERLERTVVQPPGVVDRLLSMLPGGQQHPAAIARRAQAAEFRRDWAALAPAMRDYRSGLVRDGWQQPHFGTFRDMLRLQALTVEASKRVADAMARQQRPAAADVAGIAGGMLEAYSRCVDDGQAQLATAYESEQDLRRRAPAVREGVRQAMVRDCQGGLDKLEGLRAEHSSLIAELQEAEAALAASPLPPNLGNRAQDLNMAACQP